MGISLLPPRRLIAPALLAWLVFGVALRAHVASADSPRGGGRVVEPSEAPEGSAADWQDQLQQDLEYLASDELRGRSAVDETIELAADHIAERFRAIGLQTDLFDRGPFQSVDVPLGARPAEDSSNRAEFTFTGENTAETKDVPPLRGQLGDDFMPLAVGARQAKFDGEIVFVGYGITAPELDYDDYEGIDVRGKGVMVLRKEPGMHDPESPFDGTDTSRHAYFTTKIANAIEHGAAAVLFVNDISSRDAAIRSVKEQMSAERRRARRTEEQRESLPAEAVHGRQRLEQRLEGIESALRGLSEEQQSAQRGLMGISEAGRRPSDETTIPVVSLARDTADQLLDASSGRSLRSLEQEIDADYRPASLPLPGTTVELEVHLQPTSVVSNNVLGMLPGKGGLAEETVVIGAHYDHVGMGGSGSMAPGTFAVHNGADDNASGTATMIAAAQRLARELESVAEHRRLLFIAFTAEERGLLGSKQYVRSPRFPLESTVAMINLDMVGRLRDNELTVYGTGTGDGLEAIVDQVNEATGFDLHKVATGYGPSDHQSFYEAGVPVVFFFTGLHTDYHRPSDKSDKIDFGGMTRITDMVYGVAKQLAFRQDRPAYTATDKGFRIRRQMTAFMGVTLSDRGDHVVISAMVPDGPADHAGLRRGDRLQQLGERPVGQSSDVLEALRERSPGDTLNVRVDRDGSTTEVQVQLQPRP